LALIGDREQLHLFKTTLALLRTENVNWLNP